MVRAWPGVSKETGVQSMMIWPIGMVLARRCRRLRWQRSLSLSLPLLLRLLEPEKSLDLRPLQVSSQRALRLMCLPPSLWTSVCVAPAN